MARRRLLARLALAVAIAAAGPVARAQTSSTVLVSAPADDPEAERIGGELAASLVALVPVRQESSVADPVAAAEAEGVRCVLLVSLTPSSVVLRAYAVGGRAWTRSIERTGSPEAVREHAVTAGRSMVTALLAVPPPVRTTEPERVPEPVAPAPEPTASVPSPDGARPADSVPTSQRSEKGGRGRLEGGWSAASVGSTLGLQTGPSLGFAWAPSWFAFGAGYTFFTATTVADATTAFSVARHAFDLGAQGRWRLGRFDLGAGVGPLLSVWVRSPGTSSAGTTPHAGSTFASAGALARVDATVWLTSGVGLLAGIGAEVDPWSPRYVGPAGATALDPAIVRARADFRLVGEFR